MGGMGQYRRERIMCSVVQGLRGLKRASRGKDTAYCSTAHVPHQQSARTLPYLGCGAPEALGAVVSQVEAGGLRRGGVKWSRSVRCVLHGAA